MNLSAVLSLHTGCIVTRKIIYKYNGSNCDEPIPSRLTSNIISLLEMVFTNKSLTPYNSDDGVYDMKYVRIKVTISLSAL